MVKFTIRKLFQAVLLIGVVLLFNFFILRLTPGNPYDTAQYLALSNNNGKPLSTSQQNDLKLLRNRLGIYYDPWPQAFSEWAGGILQFDFGKSVVSGEAITPVIMKAALNSFWLLSLATAIGLTLGVSLGLFAAYRPNSWQDNTIKFVTLLFIALPGWYMIQAFNGFNKWLWNLTSQHFSIIPLGNVDLNQARFWDAFEPIFFLGAILLALFWGQTRSRALLVLKQDYVRTARAKGLQSSRVLMWHVFRNSLTPIITIFGGLLPFVFATQILIENATGWGGLGQVFLRAASDRDYTILMAVFTLLVLFCVACSFLADIAYALIDPQIRETYQPGLQLAKAITHDQETTNLTGIKIRRKRVLVSIWVGLGLLGLITFGLFVFNPFGNRATQETNFENIALPAGARVLETEISNGERKSILTPTARGQTVAPEPDQDTNKGSKQTFFLIQMSGLDLLAYYGPILEKQGWVASQIYSNRANSSRVDYVFEKGNQYIWLAGDKLSGIEFSIKSNGNPLADKIFTELKQGDTLVSVVQGFKFTG